jgi:ADP-ribose pyrophosphatase YjhB (NUDIX family)
MVGVGLVGFNDRNQILLLRHVFHPTTPWGIPGGWLNRNESPAEGALRELREETGLTAVLGPPLLVSREGPPSQLCICYLAFIERDPAWLSSEIIEWGWFAPHEMPSQMLPFARTSIELAMSHVSVSDVGDLQKGWPVMSGT